jgi:gamma-glutamyltranspeptidase/glutathione hydrolase
MWDSRFCSSRMDFLWNARVFVEEFGMLRSVAFLVFGMGLFVKSAMSGDATAPRGMVATVNPIATDAGVAALQIGGNAVDAAVAAAVTLGVVDGYNSGIGGGCFVLIRQPNGAVIAIDGREMAPATASRDMYLRDGKADPKLSRTGPLAVATPGAVAAYAMALDLAGKKSLADALLPAAELAERGFKIDRILARNIKETAQALKQFSGSRAVYLDANGEPWEQGHRLVQTDLATTYRKIAEDGPDWFYRGPFAETVGQWMQSNSGILTAADFAAYQAKQREPIVSSYRGYTIVGFPPPSSGGAHVAQILNILENFDLASLHRQDPAAAQHIIAEAMKLAFADRAYWLGDADFVSVPRGLLDKEYARDLASKIQVDRTVAIESHGQPPDWQDNTFGKHTTHIAAADADGTWVAITATVNTTFGSKIIVPGTGVVLNNEMDDFSAQPGAPNAFGLIGAENNAIAPGKRPLSSMSPTIVLKEGAPVFTVGAAGGPKIITQVVLALVRQIDFGMPLIQAVSEPRIHHQWRPDQLSIEAKLDPQVRAGLLDRGHTIEELDTGGVTQAIRWLPEESVFLGVHDPRVPGKAAGL